MLFKLWYILVCFSLNSSCLHPLCFLYLDTCFCPQACEIFSHNFFKYIFDPIFPSSPPGTTIIRILVHLMLSQRSIPFLLLLLFAILSGFIPIFSLPDHLCILLYHFICYSFFLMCFSFSCWILHVWFLNIFPRSLLKFSLCISVLSLIQWAFLLTMFLILCLINYFFCFIFLF